MSNKRNSHKVVGSNSGKKGGLFKGNIPPEGVSSPVRGNGVYHSTKGFRVLRQYTPHTLLNSLMMKLGLASMYQN